jgi:hypothetical protein
VPGSQGAHASATFISEILGRSAPVRFGPFWDVELDNRATLAYIHTDEHLMIEHYAFLVSEEEFDQIFERIRSRGLPYWADPAHRQAGSINRHDGGRGVRQRGQRKPALVGSSTRTSEIFTDNCRYRLQPRENPTTTTSAT